MIKLTDAYSYDVLFTPEVTGWAELIPGYMHVRIQADMLISRSAQPGNDIVERRTPFYVYLKPHGANDADIKARGRCRARRRSSSRCRRIELSFADVPAWGGGPEGGGVMGAIR